MFDVTMGSYDGAETCELIGAYMLSLTAPKFKNEVGLYRNDGLAICKATPKEIEKKPSKKSAKCSNRMALRAILQEIEAKLEMKIFNPPSIFVWR